MIRDVGEAIGDTVVESVGRAVGRTQERRPLPADLLESDDAYLVVFDAPGVEAADVAVRFEGNAVEVRLDRHSDTSVRSAAAASSVCSPSPTIGNHSVKFVIARSTKSSS